MECVVAWTSLYYFYSSHTSVFSIYRFGSSCRVFTNSITYSNTIVQSGFVASRVARPSLIAAPPYSRTSCRVDGCIFNCSLVIFMLSSNWTQLTSAFSSRTPAANFLTFDYGCVSSGIWILGIVLHAFATTDFNRELCTWSASFPSKIHVLLERNCWLLTLILLITLRTCCSRRQSSSTTPYNSTCNNSNCNVARFKPVFDTLSWRAHCSLVLVCTNPTGRGNITTSIDGHGTITEAYLHHLDQTPLH